MTCCSKKQSLISLSSSEAKYVVGVVVTCQSNWLQSLWNDLMIKIETSFHFLRDQVTKEKLQVVYCSIEEQMVDVLTKAIDVPQKIRTRHL